MEPFGTVLETYPLTWTDANNGIHAVTVEITAPFLTGPTDPTPNVYCSQVRLTGFGDHPVYPAFSESAETALLYAKALAGRLVSTSPFAAKLNTANLPNHGFPEFPAPPSGGGGSGGGSGGQTGGEGIAAAGCGCGQ